MATLSDRLRRYDKNCLTFLLEEDFADAVHKAADELVRMKNELCLYCGNYKNAHNGACDGCRWKEVV